MPKRLDVKGNIIGSGDGWIYDWLGMEYTSPKKVNAALREANGEDIDVYINSPGGDVFAGSEIYTALREYPGKVRIKIVGIAASAASVVAQAGESEISPTGMFMIHNVKTETRGDYNDMFHSGETLLSANQGIINAYLEKTGMSPEKLQELMDQETYMSAQQAVELGFVDKVMFSDSSTTLINSASGMIPEKTIKKLRNLIKNPDHDDMDFLMQKNKAAARLRLFNLKGERR
ncbi:head maturation protease, ClpP-related [Frisingicoccus sp.]|uniref:head maturation protease, ClpP-related n=1 Tax=Frisingicoccus sp. TaxID=1918627 RepID=UPI002A7F6992|nr:head maturation protease, ClpP-related [Frisingicoccus sp.]MDY4923609.1 Clp protease ClpP [Frisingicoccus sp.]